MNAQRDTLARHFVTMYKHSSRVGFFSAWHLPTNAYIKVQVGIPNGPGPQLLAGYRVHVDPWLIRVSGAGEVGTSTLGECKERYCRGVQRGVQRRCNGL